MVRCSRSILPLLALITVGNLSASGLQPLTPFHLMALRAQETRRAELVIRDLAARKALLGLGDQDGLVETGRLTDLYGGTHVHFQQTFRGVKVWNTHLIGHLDAEGRVLPIHATVRHNIQLADEGLLGLDRIEAIARRHLTQGGRAWPLQIEKVVLPSSCQDGIKLVRNAQGSLVVDGKFSVASPARKSPFVWAYHVSSLTFTPQGPDAIELVLDARTGELLKKWDGALHAATVGVGKSQYNGTVALGSELQADGVTYVLRDTTRATRPWPLASSHPAWTELGGIGIQTLYYSPSATTVSGMMPFTSTTDLWGDGAPYAGILECSNAETAAVDAHYAIQTTWDYYASVLGRTGGIDGKGGSPASLVHYQEFGSPWANAAWDSSLFMMFYGDGGETGALTSLDVAAHEMSHGVLSTQSNLASGEAGGLNEANSDIHGIMVKFWAWGAGAKGATVPETTTESPDQNNDPLHTWTMGSQLSGDGSPLRWSYKPSKDGVSYDAWFDGIGLDDSHYAMGPGVRAFYFLAQGAKPDATDDAHSEFLPGGMPGIGNDKAVKIWYHGMATKVTDASTDYHGLRAAMIEAASDLYPGNGGGDSPEIAAVKNAFAAINVGAPEGGKEPPTLVTVSNPASKELFGDPHILIAPAMEPVALPGLLLDGVPTGDATWTLGGLSASVPAGGRLCDPTHFIAPMVSYGGSWPLKATLAAHPEIYAVEGVYSAYMDCDEDTITDACDMGALALSYQLSSTSYGAANLYGGSQGVDDICCQLFLSGFNTAFNR